MELNKNDTSVQKGNAVSLGHFASRLFPISTVYGLQKFFDPRRVDPASSRTAVLLATNCATEARHTPQFKLKVITRLNIIILVKYNDVHECFFFSFFLSLFPDDTINYN